jgi:dynein heavy chain, axonemal
VVVEQFEPQLEFQNSNFHFNHQILFKILLISEEITNMELDFLLRFPVKPHVTSPVDFISNYAWGGICSLAAKEEFRNLDRDIENQAKRWKKVKSLFVA